MSDAKLWIDEVGCTATTLGDTDATRERHDGACSDEILSYLDGEWGRDSFEYYVYSDLYDMASEILDENRKLREFTHGLIDGYECGRGELCDGCAWDGMSDPREFNCKVRAEARELGVKVTE